MTVHPRLFSFLSHKCLAQLYLDQGLVEKALTEFEEAIKLEPNDPESWYQAGKIYEAKNNNEKAINCYEQYINFGGKENATVKELIEKLKKKVPKRLKSLS